MEGCKIHFSKKDLEGLLVEDLTDGLHISNQEFSGVHLNLAGKYFMIEPL